MKDFLGSTSRRTRTCRAHHYINQFLALWALWCLIVRMPRPVQAAPRFAWHSSSWPFVGSRSKNRKRTFLGRQQPAHWNQVLVRGGGSSHNNEIDGNKHQEPPTDPNILGPVVQTPEVWPPSGQRRGLILMDAFCPYFGLYMANQARDVYGLCTISVLSNYMKQYFAQEQPDEWQHWMPEAIPVDIQAWKERLPCQDIVAVHCESDSGLPDAEQFAAAVGAIHRNDVSSGEARRNKYVMNQICAKAGIPVVKQQLCQTLNETLDFAKQLLLESEQQQPSSSSSSAAAFFDAGVLGQGSNVPQTTTTSSSGENAKTYCIVKPTRGVASEHVHLCHDLESVEAAFRDITQATVFGDASMRHEAVLVQEFSVGTEYAVDIVSRQGQHKVAALWRYDKRPANGAPFCYFATELIDPTESEIGARVCRYAQDCLTALGQKWGLSHTEVIVTARGPRLVEVNCRQHNMDFAPITMACIGYNAFDMLLAAYLDGEPDDSYPTDRAHLRLCWDRLPELPSLRVYGAMVHLVNYASGEVKEVNIPCLDEIHNMESCLELEVYPEFVQPGSIVAPTTSIRTDAGWVQILNDDANALRRDYDRIVELMPKLFITAEAPAADSEK